VRCENGDFSFPSPGTYSPNIVNTRELPRPR
jgi:hypothetical protein